jgi:hypothetical protein
VAEAREAEFQAELLTQARRLVAEGGEADLLLLHEYLLEVADAVTLPPPRAPGVYAGMTAAARYRR